MTFFSERGDTTFYILIFIVIVGAFFLVGGLGLGDALSPPNTSTTAQPIITGSDSSRNSLQLQTLKFKITPTFDCNDGTLNGSPEPGILWAILPAPGTAAAKGGNLKAFYQDELPLTLGAGDVSPSTTGKDHVKPPSVGDETQTDQNGFPYYPALFLSDTTNDPTNSSGDAQNGGTPHKPDEVFGAWKPLGNLRPGYPPNDLSLGDGADTFPPTRNVNFPGFLKYEPLFGAEIVWNIDNLNLISGHSYRAQFILHDGDQKGDISEGCTIIQL